MRWCAKTGICQEGIISEELHQRSVEVAPASLSVLGRRRTVVSVESDFIIGQR